MILTFLQSGSCLTMKVAHGLGWGPLVLPPLSGETSAGYVIAWQGGGKRGGGIGGMWQWGWGDSGDVSESVCEFGEGKGGV